MELSEKAEIEIVRMLNQYDSKKLFWSLVATTYIPTPGTQLSTHVEQHPILSLEVLGRFILDRDFTGMEDFFYPEVLDELHSYLFQYSRGLPQLNLNLRDEFTSHIERQHAMIRGNAFGWQTRDRIFQLFQKYDRKIEEEVGVKLDKIISFVYSYSSVVHKKINKNWDSFACSPEFVSILSSITENNNRFILTKNDGSKKFFDNQDEVRQYVDKIAIINFLYKELLITKENCQDFSLNIDEFQAISSLIGVSKDTYNTIGDIRYHPLLQIGKESILITQNSAFDAVLYHLDNLIKGEYGEQFKKHKASYAENMAFEALCRIFHNDNVYRNLSYPDPTKEDGKSTAELDIAVQYGRFLILCEIKSKQLREESLAGNPSKLRSDLKANIEDSLMQTQRAIKYIELANIADFKEIKHSQRSLHFKKVDIDKIYIISACYEPLADIGTRLNHAHGLSLFVDKNYPFSISISDLEVISHTSIYPSSLLHYIERRVAILHDSTEWHGDELDLFSAYLDSRLLQSNFGLSDDKPVNKIFSGYSGVFEDLAGLYYENPHDALKTLTLRLPESVTELFEELNNVNNDSAKYILFQLHEFNNALLAQIVSAIKKLKNENIPCGQLRRFFFQDGDCAVNIVGTSYEQHESLSLKTLQRLIFEKYRCKCNKSIAFAVDTRTNRLIEFAQYIESEWSLDEEMEKLVAQDNRGVMTIAGKRPGRNEKCPCGSGKKFKKCCLSLLVQ